MWILIAAVGVLWLLFLVLYLIGRGRERLFLLSASDAMGKFLDGGSTRPERIIRAWSRLQYQVAQLMNQTFDHLTGELHQLGRERDVLSHILQTMTTGVVYVDVNSRVEIMNESAMRILRSRVHQWRGVEHWIVLHHYELGAAIDNAVLYGRQWSGELALHPEVTVNAQVIPLLASNPTTPSFRQQYRALLLLNDVSAWRRMEQMRSDFVANVSHELKTPITAIQGFAEMLLQEDVDASTQKEFAEVIYTESIRMRNLVGDLLTLTKLENGERTDPFEEVSLNEVIESSLKVVSGLVDKAGIDLKLGSLAAHAVVSAKEGQLQQVLLNLLTNAIHYTPRGGLVTVWMESHEREIKVHISDTGVGIAAEHQHRVFERFYRVNKDRSRATGGTGLGLAIAKHIVQSHGGRVGVTSEVGHGSDFWFTLPVISPQESQS